jgi:hypothetical protein
MWAGDGVGSGHVNPAARADSRRRPPYKDVVSADRGMSGRPGRRGPRYKPDLGWAVGAYRWDDRLMNAAPVLR